MKTADNDQFYTAAQFQEFFRNATRSLVMKANPPYFTILAVSDNYLFLTHTQRQQLLGHGLFEVFPGSQADPSEQNSVYSSFVRAINNKAIDELPVFKYEIFVAETGQLNTEYWTNVNEPLFDEQGNVAYLINTTTNITEQIIAEQALNDAREQKQQLLKEQALNEELAAANEELLQSQKRLFNLNNELEERVARRTKDLTESQKTLLRLNEDLTASNEEQAVINEELQQAEKALLKSNRHLQASEARLVHILAQVSIPVLVLTGPRQIVATANEAMLRFWAKQQDEVMGKPMLTIFPELASQPFPNLWKQVYESGETIIGQEVPVMYNQQAGLRISYIDYHYQPLRDLDGHITGVLATIVDNTEKVIARQTVEESEERLRLTIDSANLGTWYINAATREFTPSLRLKELFGYHPDETLSFEGAVNQVADEYRGIVSAAIEEAITKGKAYDLEYPVIGYHDSKLRWVKATGKLYHTNDGQPSHFSGTAADITERKQDEQRKNDFINMVSHELKTPLTSISGYVQLLKSKAQTAEDNFAVGVMNKTYNQVKKMTTMINGFLNMSRLESGKIHLDIVEFNVEELLAEIIEESRLLFPQHTIHFTACNAIFLYADQDKIGQVVINFISNAVKYAYNSNTIDITCQKTDKQVTISVTDYGEGIQPEDQQKIFERYYRVEGKQQSTIAGFGIGLYLCAEIISRHKGQIGINSEAGKGSTFWFTLPVE